MTKITINLSDSIAIWLKGYAASRSLTPSKAVSDLLTEKRNCLAKEAGYSHALKPLIERLPTMIDD